MSKNPNGRLVVGVIVVGITLASFTMIAVGDAEKTGTKEKPDLLERIEKLQAESAADRAEISRQSKAIAALQLELKEARKAAADENTILRTALEKQIKDNRKGVYTDIGSIVTWANYPIAEMDGRDHAREGHLHFERARREGYVAGLPNGHISGTHVGSIRWMPQILVDKCKQIANE